MTIGPQTLIDALIQAGSPTRDILRFFTTKSPRRGTGLGLASIQHILCTVDGGVLKESEPGRGCAFHLLIPCLVASERRPER